MKPVHFKLNWDADLLFGFIGGIMLAVAANQVSGWIGDFTPTKTERINQLEGEIKALEYILTNSNHERVEVPLRFAIDFVDKSGELKKLKTQP